MLRKGFHGRRAREGLGRHGHQHGKHFIDRFHGAIAVGEFRGYEPLVGEPREELEQPVPEAAWVEEYGRFGVQAQAPP